MQPSMLSVIHVLIMGVSSDDYDRVLHDSADDAQRVAATIAGVVGVDVYGAPDHSEVMLISQWTDETAWSKAQWDELMQDVVVARFRDARRVHAKLYHRVDLKSSAPS